LIGALKVDWYLVNDDFGSYLDANKLVDEAYKDQDSWAEKYCHL
jgi:starch phosphorylase